MDFVGFCGCSWTFIGMVWAKEGCGGQQKREKINNKNRPRAQTTHLASFGPFFRLRGLALASVGLRGLSLASSRLKRGVVSSKTEKEKKIKLT